MRWTALMAAARNGDATCVRALLAAGALVNTRGQGGQSALHVAAAHGRSVAIGVAIGVIFSSITNP